MILEKEVFDFDLNYLALAGCPHKELRGIEGVGDWLARYKWKGDGQHGAPSAVIHPAEDEESL